jgi:alpha-ketoglutarate-dependent taurine dioxygenase
MIYTEPIEFPGIDEIKNNFNHYKNKFINDSFLVFRNANLSNEEHLVFHKTLGDLFGWHTNVLEGKTSSYTENHSSNELMGSVGKDEIMLKWHIEHIYYENPIVAATWNMSLFKTNSENGKTYFVDIEKVYSKMSDDYKSFLSRCMINAASVDNGIGHSGLFKNNFKAIEKHWITNNPIIRVRILEKDESNISLVSFDNSIPNQDEINKFDEICLWISNEVYNNEDIRIVHKWNKGDIFIPDMFKLAHAVTGGFDPKDRQFTGIWGHQFNDFSFLIPK